MEKLSDFRGTEEIISKASLRKKIKSGKRLRIKYGVDPSSSDIHLGHAVALRILKRFQDLGHSIIFLVGDYTALVGDPSGKNKTRPILTHKEISKNAESYLDQVGKILNVKKTEIRKNSEWYAKTKLDDLIKIASNFSVASIIERDDFEKRLKEGREISMHELLYPIMQAYDSVMLKSDVEIGGTDQRFNMLAGRSLQKKLGQTSQDVIMSKLLVGTDGSEKMSKSLSNYVGINEDPDEMFGKIMSIKDEMIINYFILCTDVADSKIKEVETGLKKRKNPRDYKLDLAHTIVKIYHNDKEANQAKEQFIKQFSKREVPNNIPKVSICGKVNIVSLLTKLDKNISKSEARRLIEQGGVTIEGTRIEKTDEIVDLNKNMVIKVGKRRYWQIN